MKAPKFKAGDHVVSKGILQHKIHTVEDPNALEPIDTMFEEPYIRIVGDKTVYAQSGFVKINTKEELIEWAKEGFVILWVLMGLLGAGISLYYSIINIW